MRKVEASMLLVVIIAFILGAYLYPYFPDQIASHWNIRGEVNGYMPKLAGLFIMPVIAFLFFLLFLAIPRIDPLKYNIEKFRGYYERFVLLVILFLFYLDLLVIWWSLGARFNLIQYLAPAFAILIYYAGILMEKAKRNWFIGVRTPWTMSSDKVWNKTSKVGGLLFKIAGIIALIGTVLPDYAIFLIVVPIILFTVYLFVYSYQEYEKEVKGKRRQS
jgi:uncharacterized membrane protein